MRTAADAENPTEPNLEAARVLTDIRVAEDQIARGEGVAHDAAREQVLARLRLNHR